VFHIWNLFFTLRLAGAVPRFHIIFSTNIAPLWRAPQDAVGLFHQTPPIAWDAIEAI
jgi:hypothetical protein